MNEYLRAKENPNTQIKYTSAGERLQAPGGPALLVREYNDGPVPYAVPYIDITNERTHQIDTYLKFQGREPRVNTLFHVKNAIGSARITAGFDTETGETIYYYGSQWNHQAKPVARFYYGVSDGRANRQECRDGTGNLLYELEPGKSE